MSVLTAARPGPAFDTEEDEELAEFEPSLSRGFEFVDGQLEELNASFLSTFLLHGRSDPHPPRRHRVSPFGDTDDRTSADGRAHVRGPGFGRGSGLASRHRRRCQP